MSTVAEIEAAIEQLRPEEFRELREWIISRREGSTVGQWSPEELEAAAEKMVAENDPVQADALAKRIVGGFYGDTGA